MKSIFTILILTLALSVLISCGTLPKSSTPEPQNSVADNEFDDDKDLELTYLAKFLFHEVEN